MGVERFRNKWFVLAAVMLGSVMGPIDASIVNVVLPTIAEFFKADMPTVQWVPMIYLLTISSLLLLYGRLGDIFGYKKVYLSGLGSFVIGSILCGLSSTVSMLILFRAIQGLAAGMMMSVPYAIITAAFPPAERGKALGINAISIAAGLAIGPSLGGFIASLMGWRFVFYINVPIGVAGLIWANRIIPEEKGEPGKLDIGGAIAAFISLFSFLLLVNRFQNLGLGFVSFSLLSLAIIFSFIFLWVEKKTPQPMLNLSLLSNRTFFFANLSAMLNFMSQYVMVFLTPFYLQRVLHYSASSLGLVMTSFPLIVLCVAPFSGILSDRVGTRSLACIGAVLCALALFLMSQLGNSASSIDVAWRLALFGFGTGIFQPSNNSAVMGSAPRPHLGVASGILATMRNVGMVLGVAAGGAVLYGFVPSELLQKPYLEASEAQIFLSGLRYAYLAGATLTGIAFLTSLLQTAKAASTPNENL